MCYNTIMKHLITIKYKSKLNDTITLYEADNEDQIIWLLSVIHNVYKARKDTQKNMTVTINSIYPRMKRVDTRNITIKNNEIIIKKKTTSSCKNIDLFKTTSLPIKKLSKEAFFTEKQLKIAKEHLQLFKKEI